MKPQTGLYS
jgi:hypothetical protein